MARKVALRCSMCGIDWPNNDLYDICPVCQDEDGTDPCNDGNPLSAKEALSMKRHAEFERFYDEWDATRPAERLSPKKLDASPA